MEGPCCIGVNGVGQGHRTQAKTVLGILEARGIDVPLVVVARPPDDRAANTAAGDAGWSDHFAGREVLFEPTHVTAEDMSTMDVLAMLNVVRTAVSSRDPVVEACRRHGVRFFVGFFLPSIRSFGVPRVDLAYQHAIMDPRTMGTTALTNAVPVALGECSHLPLVIPTLIEDRHLVRRPVPGLCLAYAVSGTDFDRLLAAVARHNPAFTIHYFKRDAPRDLPANVVTHAPSRDAFRDLQEICACVVCTAGNELIQECVLDGTPVACAPASAAQFEQVHNMRRYVRQGFAEPLRETTDLAALAARDVTGVQRSFRDVLRDRDATVLRVLEAALYSAKGL